MDHLSNVQTVDTVRSFWVVGSSWKILGSSYNIELPGRIQLEGVSGVEYKGLKQLEKTKGTRVRVSDFSGLRLSILVTSKDIGTGVKMNWAEIRRSFIIGVDSALSDLRGTETGFMLESRCCRKYNDVAAYKSCTRCKNIPLRVFGPDLWKFGGQLIEVMNRQLEMLGYNCWLLLDQLERNRDLELYYLRGSLLTLDAKYVESVGLAICTKFSLCGRALFWNRDMVKEFDTCNGLEEERFCMFIANHGEFHLRVFDPESPQQSERDGVEIKYITLRTSMLDELRDSGIFRIPKVEAICSNAYENTGQIQSWIDKLFEFRMKHNKRDAWTAESVMHLCVRNKKKSIQHCFPDLLSSFLEVSRRVIGRDISSLLRSSSLQRLFKHIENTLMVLAETLKVIMCTVTHARASNRRLESIPSLANVQLAAACEALIAFWIYGNFLKIPMNGPQKCFSEALLSALKLNKTTFEESPHAFKALKWCPGVVGSSNGLLIYNGTMCLTKDSWPHLMEEIAEDHVTIFNAVVMSFSNNLVSEGDQMKTLDILVKFVWNAIQQYASEKLYNGNMCCAEDPASVRRLMSTFCGPNAVEQFVSCREFTEILFNSGDYYSQLSLSHVLRELKTVLGERIFAALKCRLARRICYTLYKSRSLALLYPFSSVRINSSSSYSVLMVVPTGNADEINFLDLDDLSRQSLIDHFLFIIKCLYPHKWKETSRTTLESVLGLYPNNCVNDMLSRCLI